MRSKAIRVLVRGVGLMAIHLLWSSSPAAKVIPISPLEAQLKGFESRPTLVSRSEYIHQLRRILHKIENLGHIRGSAQRRKMIEEIQRESQRKTEVQLPEGVRTCCDHSQWTKGLDELMRKGDWEALQSRLKGLALKFKALIAELEEDDSRFFKRQDELSDPRIALDSILSRKEFQYDQRVYLAEWAREMILRAVRRLGELWDRYMPSLSGLGSKPVQYITYAFLAFLTGVLVWFVVKDLVPFLLPSSVRRKKTGLPKEGKRDKGDAQWPELRKEGLRMAKRGSYRQAIRMLLLSLLMEWDEKGILPFERSQTNLELSGYLVNRELLFKAFRCLALHFDRLWYGQKDCSKKDYESFKDLFDQALKAA